MVRMSEGLKLAERLVGISIDALAAEIADIYQKHQENNSITLKERLIIGLAYSEFYTDGTSDGEYYRAEVKRQSYLKLLGINGGELVHKVEELL